MRLTAAIALAVLTPAALSAQAQVQAAASITSAVIEACYVKSSGSIYRINAPNAPSKCATNGTPMSWNVQGPQGPAGPAGPSGLTGYRTVTEAKSVLPQTEDFLTASCADGEVVLAGGYSAADVSGKMFKNMVVPTNTFVPPNKGWLPGWFVQVINTDPSLQIFLYVYAICAKTAN